MAARAGYDDDDDDDNDGVERRDTQRLVLRQT